MHHHALKAAEGAPERRSAARCTALRLGFDLLTPAGGVAPRRLAPAPACRLAAARLVCGGRLWRLQHRGVDARTERVRQQPRRRRRAAVVAQHVQLLRRAPAHAQLIVGTPALAREQLVDLRRIIPPVPHLRACIHTYIPDDTTRIAPAHAGGACGGSLSKQEQAGLPPHRPAPCVTSARTESCHCERACAASLRRHSSGRSACSPA